MANYEFTDAIQQTTTLKALRAMVAQLEYKGTSDEEPLTFVLMGEDIWFEQESERS